MKKYKSQPRNQFPRRGVVLTRPASKKCTDKGGITLISLVVTIIILLILAGVTLALISGSDGILGRATHALDENKIAMAKEQVELALSDFQTEFYEGKYVERTEDGTKKEYISEKLQAGVETTNFYVQASVEGNVTVYEGKDNSVTEVVKGAIQEDASIKWDDVASGNLGGNGGSGEGGDGSGGTIDSVELATLNSKIEQLQNKITNLEEQLKNEIIVNKRVNLMNTPVEIPVTTTWEERNIDITLSDSVEKYKYLEVQWDVSDGNQYYFYEDTSFIAREQLRYNNSNDMEANESPVCFSIGIENSWICGVYWLKNDRILHVGASDSGRTDWKKLRIRKIYGIQ